MIKNANQGIRYVGSNKMTLKKSTLTIRSMVFPSLFFCFGKPVDVTPKMCALGMLSGGRLRSLTPILREGDLVCLVEELGCCTNEVREKAGVRPSLGPKTKQTSQ